jgi:hypothetical protein
MMRNLIVMIAPRLLLGGPGAIAQTFSTSPTSRTTAREIAADGLASIFYRLYS